MSKGFGSSRGAGPGHQKVIVWMGGEVKTPPFSPSARIEAGMLLRRLQYGQTFGMPHSRPMPGIGKHCHELRVVDGHATWRIVYRLDVDAIVILDVFQKKTAQTPLSVINRCKERIARYDTT